MTIELINENNIKYTIKFWRGDKYWYLNDQLHRENGPALERANGSKLWYRNNLLHREGGPAIEFDYGDKYWYRNNVLHREDGPAVEHADGGKRWYLNDQLLPITSNEQFMRMMNLKTFL